MNIAKWTIVAITLAGLGYMGFRISQRVEVVKAEREVQAKPVEVPAPAVETAPLVAHDYVSTLTVTGELMPKATVNVLPKMPGEVKVLHVEVGQTIDAGKPIATLDSGDLPLRRKQVLAQKRAAQAGVAQARVAVANATVEVERARRLAKANAIPEADLERAEAGLKKAAEAAVRAAGAQVGVASSGIDLIDHSLGYIEVVAPRSGVITKVMTTLGAMAAPSAPLVEIQDQSELRLHMNVPADALKILETNPKVEFTVAAFPGRTFTGVVKLVSPTLDPQSRRAHVEVLVDAGQQGLLPHMFAEVGLATSRRDGVVSAPIKAVLTTVKGSHVFLARGGKAAQVAVDLGAADANFVPVPGAKAGDQVIVSGQGDLADGGEVRVVEPGSAEQADGKTAVDKNATSKGGADR